MKYRLLALASLTYASAAVAYLVLTRAVGWYVASIDLANEISLAIYPLLLVPLVWLLPRRRHEFWSGAWWCYLFVLLLTSPIVLFSLFSTVNDLRLGNGDRPVYEVRLNDEERLVIYRTRDKGAFGGDHLASAVVESAPIPGFERRVWIPHSIGANGAGTSVVSINGVEISVPTEGRLREKGRLRHDVNPR